MTVRDPAPIAIVGMRGRFPGADDLDTFWRNLADGVESITELTSDELRASGVPDHIARLPGYVNVAPMLGDVDLFDAGFFGFSARDASLTDPQHRLFLETAWETLEDAGYDPATYTGAIGVFGGCELSSYLYQLYQNADALGYVDGMQLMVTNDKDHLCTQVSYRLNLRGPSVAVQTTCSTSLVAVAIACQSLQAHSCDLALAGGVTVRVPQRAGYFYTAGSILSPDGHCRPFDARAQGTVVGSGVGIVALKRLEDAIADDDSIRAVILGVGINNDGSDKVGYTAPGFRGQVAAITAAYERAGVSPESVGYVEAHGTGTILGDPIELSALTEVFRQHTDRRGFCGVGSLKSNVGHLSCASGVAGLIKTVLTLQRGAIPPTVHYQRPNPAIDFAAGPFYVTTSLHPWARNGSPRRAAVSSFGVGGTNAHAVLEEAPTARPLPERRSSQILTVSARSAGAATEAARRLGEHLERHPEQDLADVAHTLHVGRRAFRHRRAVVVDADDRAGAVAALGEGASAVEAADEPRVVFMFPGQGAQYPEMARGLYEGEPVVRDAIDECCDALLPDLGLDLRSMLLPGTADAVRAADVLRDTALAQPALFVVEYALAQLWRSWGVEPTAMIGHSVGEYVAATLAGVLGRDDALQLLARRGRLISALPRGSMLAVMAPADAVVDLVDDDISLAAVNAPGLCVLSGPTGAVERVARVLEGRSVPARQLHTSHAFHSSMMDPMLAEFEDVVRGVSLAAPALPYVATLGGTWADGQVTDPAYWSRQIRSAVRFGDGLRTLAASATVGEHAVLLEVGPGRTLATFGAHTASSLGCTWSTLSSLPGADEERSDHAVVLESLGRLWEHGVAVDWRAFHRNERRRRVSLPTYPFERDSYWIGTPVRPRSQQATEPRDVTGWFSVPAWRAVDAPDRVIDPDGAVVVVLDEGTGLGQRVADRARAAGATPIVVRRGERFDETGDGTLSVAPGEAESFNRLAAVVCSRARITGVVDCWAAVPPGGTDLRAAAEDLVLGPLRLALAFGRHATARPLPVLLVARGADRVLDGDVIDPPRAFGAGVAKVIPQEHTGFRYAHMDVDDHPEVPAMILGELLARLPEPEVAARGGVRYARVYEPRELTDDAPGLPPAPVVLVTGGLGHMGLILSDAVFTRFDARLVLVARSDTIDRTRLRSLTDLGPSAGGLLAELERLADGGVSDRVMVVGADVGDRSEVHDAVDAAIARFGRVDVVVHGAANVGNEAFGLVADTGPEVIAAQLSPKIVGLSHLVRSFDGREPKHWIVHSSISSVLGGLGLAAYAGANAVLDAMARAGGPNWLSIDWDAWDNAGEAQTAAISAIAPVEGQAAFLRLLGDIGSSRLVVATEDLEGRLDSWVRRNAVTSAAPTTAKRHARPNLATAFVEARSDTERSLAEIWGSQLGLDRVGIHDRFFDLGGHSLLAVQVASEIRDRFLIDIPVPELFKAPTIAELAALVDIAVETGGFVESSEAPSSAGEPSPDAPLSGDAPAVAAKTSYREFYDDITRRLAATGMAEASFFLNYGYVSDGTGDEAVADVGSDVFNPNSIRLALELVGGTDLEGRTVLDVGCGRGGTVALLAQTFGAVAVGVDLSPEAIAFCRRAHVESKASFEVGDAEHLPFEDSSFDVVTNLESSHTYPDIRAFLGEVRRVLRAGGWFLHTDLLPSARWAEVRALLDVLGLSVVTDREITANVLASCDAIASGRTEAFGERSAVIDNFLAVPGSPVYEQMASGAWEYRIVRSRRR